MSPTAAAREFLHNPHFPEILTARLYRRAFDKVEAYETADLDAQKQMTRPSGPLAVKAWHNRRIVLEGQMEAADRAKREAGRA